MLRKNNKVKFKENMRYYFLLFYVENINNKSSLPIKNLLHIFIMKSIIENFSVLTLRIRKE